MNRIINGDCIEELKKLPDKCIHTCVTSPPYFGLRDYGVDGQIGLEETLEAYVERLVHQSWRVESRWLWTKTAPRSALESSICSPNRWLDFAPGYHLVEAKSHARERNRPMHEEPSKYPDDDRKARSAISDKRMPTDLIAGVRPGSQTYPFRNRRSVWTVTTRPYKGAHFATFPPDLIEPCILAGAPIGGIILDPFLGSGTTAMVAVMHSRRYIGIELNKQYIKLAQHRIASVQLPIEGIAA